LLYLTGFNEPESALVLRPGAANDRVVLFVRPKDREREIWEGRRAGPAGAVSDYGADVAYDIHELPAKLTEYAAQADDLHYALGVTPAVDAMVTGVLQRMRLGERRLGRPPARVVDPRAVLHELRLRKTPDEIDLLSR